VFGRVVDGMQWVDAIARGEPPAAPSRILQASMGDDHKAPPPFPAPAPAAAAPPPASPEAAPTR
jgi:peptidylprolyl isomerase